MRQNREKFFKDLQIIYREITERDKKLRDYYNLLQEEHHEAREVVKELLDVAGMRENPESVFGALSRLIDLREDLLKQAMENQRFSKNRVIEILSRVYIYVDRFYTNRFEELVAWIEEKGLLTPFYRALIYGVHSVGISISQWQNSWTSHIIYGTNRELFRLFNGDEDKIFEMLRRENLFDRKYKNMIADRSYSVLISTNRGYKKLSYAEAFAQEVKEVSLALNGLIDTLEELDDDVFNQKKEWINYFHKIYRAFNNRNSDKLVRYWADVDRAWIKIKTPIQVGHPIESYEDRYRKSVALEWDLRMVNPTLQSGITIKKSIKTLAFSMLNVLGRDAQSILSKNLDQIENTQIYIGRPFLYYGAELNGLFSAQVAPNDKEVSNKFGKKIFAYPDFVRESKISKPVMSVMVESMGREFIKKQKGLAKYYPSLWNQIYEMSTIGHEFGHILWIDVDTESRMNFLGEFKNIEEFKATVSGLLAFFNSETPPLREYIIDDLVNRAVSLISWKDTDSVLPYYCEGLMHLEILWLSGVIEFDNLTVKIDYRAYDRLKELYKLFYTDLVKHYIEKKCASEYLFKFVEKSSKEYLPRIPEIREFVLKFFHRYKNGGAEVVDFTVD